MDFHIRLDADSFEFRTILVTANDWKLRSTDFRREIIDWVERGCTEQHNIVYISQLVIFETYPPALFAKRGPLRVTFAIRLICYH
jgi:hypothetical protein